MPLATILAEIDEEGRVVDIHLKNQVLPLPENIWPTVVREITEGLAPGLRAVECEVEIADPERPASS